MIFCDNSQNCHLGPDFWPGPGDLLAGPQNWKNYRGIIRTEPASLLKSRILVILGPNLFLTVAYSKKIVYLPSQIKGQREIQWQTINHLSNVSVLTTQN